MMSGGKLADANANMLVELKQYDPAVSQIQYEPPDKFLRLKSHFDQVTENTIQELVQCVTESVRARGSRGSFEIHYTRGPEQDADDDYAAVHNSAYYIVLKAWKILREKKVKVVDILFNSNSDCGTNHFCVKVESHIFRRRRKKVPDKTVEGRVDNKKVKH